MRSRDCGVLPACVVGATRRPIKFLKAAAVATCRGVSLWFTVPPARAEPQQFDNDPRFPSRRSARFSRPRMRERARSDLVRVGAVRPQYATRDVSRCVVCERGIMSTQFPGV